MTQSAAATSSQSANGPQTLAQLYTRSERGSSSSAPRAVLRTKGEQGWVEMPAWRFFRQVVRIGLYLQERAKLQPGDRVVVVSPLRAERLVAEWATIAQGAVAVTMDPGVSDEVLAGAIGRHTPRFVFARGPGERERVTACGPVEGLALIEGTASDGDGVVTWGSALELGGTLDTAERAQAFRSTARAVRPEMPAVAHPEGGDGAWKISTHAEMVDRLIDFWDRFASRPGDVAYVVESGSLPGARLALWAFVADGQTTIVLGTPGRELEEVAELRPSLLVGSPDIARALPDPGASQGSVKRREGERVIEWLQRLARLAPLARRLRPADRELRWPRHVLTLDGMRIGQ